MYKEKEKFVLCQDISEPKLTDLSRNLLGWFNCVGYDICTILLSYMCTEVHLELQNI